MPGGKSGMFPGIERLHQSEEYKRRQSEDELLRTIGRDRLVELAQAEKDGRLVVLPCKAGDIVYDIQDGTPYATKVLSFSYSRGHWACRTVSGSPDLKQFGKRIFLTRTEAEAALERRKEEKNE